MCGKQIGHFLQNDAYFDQNIPFVLLDPDIFRVNEMSDLYDDLETEIAFFEENCSHVTLHRQNTDSGMNNYGYRLTEFCRDNSIYILNGRTNGNRDICNTCKDVSTVDYFLVSPEMFKYVDNLTVSDFFELLSDVHNPISPTLNISHTLQSARSNIHTERIKLYDCEKGENFVTNLDENNLSGILNNIMTLESIR